MTTCQLVLVLVAASVRRSSPQRRLQPQELTRQVQEQIGIIAERGDDSCMCAVTE